MKGALLGPSYSQEEIEASLQKCGAKFEDVGQWKRAWYYPINMPRIDTIYRESLFKLTKKFYNI